jgi:hypothetical protein
MCDEAWSDKKKFRIDLLKSVGMLIIAGLFSVLVISTVKGSSLLLTFGAIYNKENRCIDH